MKDSSEVIKTPKPFNELLNKLESLIKNEKKYFKSSNKFDLTKINDNLIDYNILRCKLLEYSISENDYNLITFLLQKLKIQRVLEIGRFLGLSCYMFSQFCDVVSIDNNSSEADFVINVSSKIFKNKNLSKNIFKKITINNKFVDSISRKFLKDFNVNYVDETFNKESLRYNVDLIFEDITNRDSLYNIDFCLQYLNTHHKCIYIMHDDARFVYKHEYLKKYKDNFNILFSEDLNNIFSNHINFAIVTSERSFTLSLLNLA